MTEAPARTPVSMAVWMVVSKLEVMVEAVLIRDCGVLGRLYVWKCERLLCRLIELNEIENELLTYNPGICRSLNIFPILISV